MALFTARGLGIPVVVSVRAVPALEYDSAKTRIPAFLLFGSAAGVILQTEEAKAFFPRKIRKRSVILPNPINPAFLRPRYEGEREKTVVCVGRIDKNKNQELLLRAFARCLDRHPEYVLHFYGAGEEEQLKHLAKDLGAEKNTVFHGSVSDIPERIEKAGIFVLPSKTEGMPNALIEAMSLGLACISTDCPCGGPRELIRDAFSSPWTMSAPWQRSSLHSWRIPPLQSAWGGKPKGSRSTLLRSASTRDGRPTSSPSSPEHFLPAPLEQAACSSIPCILF